MPQAFTAAPHHDVLVLLVQVAALLISARVLGEIAQRLGQSSVVGEILAGVLLGPSLLSGLIPALGEWLVPHTEVQGYLLELVGMFGVMFLLLITGLETDLGLIRRHARTAISVSLGGVLLMFSAGFVLGQFIPDDLLVNPADRLVFELFWATALSISAIPVIAKVLLDLRLMRRDIGQTMIAAAMMDDSIGWAMLSVVIGLASGVAINAGTVFGSILKVLAVAVGALTIGRWLLTRSLSFIQSYAISRDRELSLVIFAMFVGGAITQALDLEALLGAFVVGIVFAQIPTLSAETVHRIEAITFGIFSPIFFAVAGLKINIATLMTPRLLLLLALVLVVAMVFKVSGNYIGARLFGKRDHWSGLFFGFGLNTRGSMGIIIANIGLSLGLISQDLFSILVVNAIITSLIAPPALRAIIRRVEVSPDERSRLEREALLEHNLIANVRRVLLPVRVRPGVSAVHTIEARILERLGQGNNVEVTLLSVASPGQEAASNHYVNELARGKFAGSSINKKIIISDRPGDVILDEAHRGYDLMVLGATEKSQDQRALFNPIIDYVVRLAPCPSLIVHAEQLEEGWQPQRILVPTNGSQEAKRAAEVAFSLVGNRPEAEVTVLNVIQAQQTPTEADNYRMIERQMAISQRIVDEVQILGNSFGVQTDTLVEVAARPSGMIIEVAQAEESDLIILGVAARAGSERLYLGPMVEYILTHAPCPVIVVNAAF
jgi:Kef-type K+ transport system membrane component KefB/nucleotide-binding universal stress UspA family protein